MLCYVMLCYVMLCYDVMLSDRHNVVILAGSGVVMASVQSVTARHCPDATNTTSQQSFYRQYEYRHFSKADGFCQFLVDSKTGECGG